MNVYVESNFVLELTLLQEEHESCEQILSVCENRQATLVIPAFSLAEPNETLFRRDKSRKQLANTVEAELRQLGRSVPYKPESDSSKVIVDLLTRSGSEEKQRLNEVRNRLLQVSDIVSLDTEVLSVAPSYETQHGFLPQDALVFASVLRHLLIHTPDTACFINRNFKDFDDPDVKDHLLKFNCKSLFSFSEGYRYLQSQI